MRAIYIAKGSPLLPPAFASIFDDLASSSLDVYFDPSRGLINIPGFNLGNWLALLFHLSEVVMYLLGKLQFAPNIHVCNIQSFLFLLEGQLHVKSPAQTICHLTLFVKYTCSPIRLCLPVINVFLPCREFTASLYKLQCINWPNQVNDLPFSWFPACAFLFA